MARSAAVPVVGLLIALALIAAPYAEGAISCGTVDSLIAPCVAYARTSGGVPPGGCCSGVRSLNAAARTTPDRQAACNCLKAAASRISGLNPATLAGIPGKCGVNLPYTISTSINCAR